jgi:hypothetical protein
MSDRTTMHQLATEIAALRRELDVQFRRIASIQAELDVLRTLSSDARTFVAVSLRRQPG